MGHDRSRILIIEDDSATRELLGEYLETEGEFEILPAQDAWTGFHILGKEDVDLVLLDVMLPDESGFSLCTRIKSAKSGFLPIILVTALNSVSDRVKGLEAGADDFISKPICRQELVARARSHLRTKRMMDRVEEYRLELSRFNQRLKEEVHQRTVQLSTALAELKRAKEEVEMTRLEIVERLGIAAEYRDLDTGMHVRRMATFVAELARAYGLPPETVELYRLAAPMHDIGKMGVKDHVLLKPTQLEEGEVELIREHTLIGARILANPRTELMVIAQQMARGHHERWDGSGYPDGIKGEEIPLPARICAVADVFDALTSGRVYRPVGMSVQETAEDILAGAGTRFDPRVVEAFRGARGRLEAALQEVSI